MARVELGLNLHHESFLESFSASRNNFRVKQQRKHSHTSGLLERLEIRIIVAAQIATCERCSLLLPLRRPGFLQPCELRLGNTDAG